MAKSSYSVYELIDEISPRLGMYIGEESADKLACYIWGYKKAMHELGIPENPELDFRSFTKWVRNKYKYPFSAEIAGCEKTILAVTLDIPPEDIKWENFPPEITHEQHRKSVTLFVKLINEYRGIQEDT